MKARQVRSLNNATIWCTLFVLPYLTYNRPTMNKQTAMRYSLTVSLLVIILVAVILLVFSQPVHAAPKEQIPVYTPTPGPDGRIIYIVKANDTLLSISLLTGVPVDELKELNNLTSDIIFEGQELLLGLAGPLEVTPTSGPPPTATPVLPTPTRQPGFGNLCILLFDDLNGDSIRQEDEVAIPEGAISIGDSAGLVSKAAESVAGIEPQCFEDLPEGEYTISVAVPEGYNPTTETSYEIVLGQGEEIYLNFGAQANTQTLEEMPTLPPDEGGKSPILGIVGGLFLLAGIVVAIFAWRMMRNS